MIESLSPIIAAFIPVAADGVRAVGRALARKLGGGPAPADVAEWVQLQDADTRRLESIAKLDSVIGTPTQWVIDLRASARYVAVLVIVLATLVIVVAAAFAPVEATAISAAQEWGASAFFFLFGDRMNQRQRGES